MKYKVVISETLERTVEVESCSEAEAEATVRRMYRRGDVVLSSDDYVDTEFSVVPVD